MKQHKPLEIVILGGDHRQVELIRKLQQLSVRVTIIGFDKLENSFVSVKKEAIEAYPFEKADALFLPVSGVLDNGELTAVFSHDALSFTTEMLKRTKKDCKIYTGIITNTLATMLEEVPREVTVLFDRDDLAIYNSIPTAEGALFLAMKHTDFTIHGSKVAILGFGRIALSLLRTFQALQAEVIVLARRSSQLARAYEMGAKAYPLDEMKEHMTDVDICLNTIPAPILTKEVLTSMPLHTFILDLASAPGGTDFTFATQRGMNAILAPGIPGMIAPRTAGKILADVCVERVTADFFKRSGAEC